LHGQREGQKGCDLDSSGDEHLGEFEKMWWFLKLWNYLLMMILDSGTTLLFIPLAGVQASCYLHSIDECVILTKGLLSPC
jgi:hypothetical protein